eukprot:Gb_20346 [translate_table: standard]
MKKQIDHLSHLLEKNNIGVPDSIKQSSSSQDSSKAKDKNDKVKGKVLVVVASSLSTPSWVIDSGASHHMGSSQVYFSSLEPYDMSSITLGDDTPAIVLGRGSVEVEGGTFTNVLSVPSLSTNLPSVYQITHLGEGMRIQFSLDSIEIRMLHINTTIAVGNANHQSSIDSESSDRDSSPSTPSHSSKDEDSPPNSPTTSTLWAKHALKSVSTWVGDPSDIRRTHSQF